jgi:hypothetical protein
MNEELANVIKNYRSHPQFLGIDILDLNQLGALDDTMLHIAASMSMMLKYSSLGAQMSMLLAI